MMDSKSKLKVVILRGLPGAGKSTYAKTLVGFNIVSADLFPELYDEHWSINFDKIGQAHDWCYSQFVSSLKEGKSVCVDNTNVSLCEIAPYRMEARRAGAEVIYQTFGKGIPDEKLAERTLHGVPISSIRAMRERWEKIPSFW